MHIKRRLKECFLFGGLFRVVSGNVSCQVEGVRRPVRIHTGGEGLVGSYEWISTGSLRHVG